MSSPLNSSDLVGARADDPAGFRPCGNKGFTGLSRGMRIDQWGSPERAVTAPPDVKGGPFTELKLSPTPAAVVAGRIFRWRATSDRSILQIIGDALQTDIYEVEAYGVRIRDRHSESVLIEGTPWLRTEGENAQRLLVETENRELVSPGGTSLEATGAGKVQSSGWTLLERDFEREIAAVEVPDDWVEYPARLDWSLVASIPRLEMLIDGGALRIDYRPSRIRLRDLFELTDVAGEPVGGRFAYYLAREIAYDLFSVRKQHGFRDWMRFAGSLLTFLGGLGSLSWLLSEVLSALF